MEIIEKIREANRVIIGVTFLLFLIGLVGLSSIAVHQDGTIQSSSFLKQTLFVLPGIVLFLFTFYLPKSFYHKSAYWVYGFILLAILFPFIGEKIAGTYRWIDIGPLGIQPSEFSKWIVVIVLARYLSDYNFNAKTAKEQSDNYPIYSKIYDDVLKLNSLKFSLDNISIWFVSSPDS